MEGWRAVVAGDQILAEEESNTERRDWIAYQVADDFGSTFLSQQG